ncbi:MAG TPA: hypothetical protein VGC01_08915, partial [Mucilaginibacter sp.]
PVKLNLRTFADIYTCGFIHPGILPADSAFWAQASLLKYNNYGEVTGNLYEKATRKKQAEKERR